MTVIVFRVIPDKSVVLAEPEEAPTLEELQDIVGGYIEIVYLKDGSQLIVNEDGYILKLPYNEEASNLYGDVIIGNAVVLSGEHKIS